MNEATPHKPSSRLIKPKRETNAIYGLRLFAALIVTAAIHVPFAFMNGNPPPPPPELDFGETTQAISLPPGHFVPKTEPIEKQSVPPIEEARNNIAPPPVLSVPLDIDVSTLAQLISDNWNDKTEISLPLAQPISPAHGVFWHSENGRLLLTPPENDAQRQALALSHGVPTQTTAIEIAPSPLLPMPRVIVRRSCGNAELDMLALDAVRLTLAKAGPLPLTPGASPEKPLVLIIDWRL